VLKEMPHADNAYSHEVKLQLSSPLVVINNNLYVICDSSHCMCEVLCLTHASWNHAGGTLSGTNLLSYRVNTF
jgi:hypothetical protein